MLKIISKYEARILVHDFDCVSFGAIVALTVVLGLAQCFVRFTPISPPVANFETVMPHGQQIYSYYNLPNPKVKQQPQMLELASKTDPMMTYFKFADVVKMLPYSDPACPPEGLCIETL